jgi:hypothetical protein
MPEKEAMEIMMRKLTSIAGDEELPILPSSGRGKPGKRR